MSRGEEHRVSHSVDCGAPDELLSFVVESLWPLRGSLRHQFLDTGNDAAAQVELRRAQSIGRALRECGVQADSSALADRVRTCCADQQINAPPLDPEQMKAACTLWQDLQAQWLALQPGQSLERQLEEIVRS